VTPLEDGTRGMPRKGHFSLLIIPHSENGTREIGISRPLLWAASALLALGVCGLLLCTIGYHIRLYRMVRISAFESENKELRSRFGRVLGEVKALQRRVEDLTETDRRMRAWTSLSEPGEGVRRMGVGGAAGTAPWDGLVTPDADELLSSAYARVEDLSREAEFLETSFDSISSILGRDEQVLLHTPSIFPLSPGAPYYYSSGFGYRTHPFTGRREFHKGLDIAGRTGTDILVAADGVVQKVDRDRGLGIYVAIDHGFGYRTLYGHLRRRPALKVGQKVSRGEVIGELGDTGRSTGPHLHYGVFKRRRPVNPRDYFADGRRWASIF